MITYFTNNCTCHWYILWKWLNFCKYIKQNIRRIKHWINIMLHIDAGRVSLMIAQIIKGCVWNSQPQPFFNSGDKKFTFLRTWVLFKKYWNSSSIYILSGWRIMNIIEQVTETYLVQYSGTLTQGGVVKWFTPPGRHCTEIIKVSKTFCTDCRLQSTFR